MSEEEIEEFSEDINDVEDDSPTCPFCSSILTKNDDDVWVCESCEIMVTITPYEELSELEK